MTDAPKINATLNDLDSGAQAGSFVLGLKGGKRITFPDPGAMEWTAAEEFLQDLQSQNTRGMLEKWLSPADFKKLLADKLNLYQISELGKLVNAHYEAIFGEQGNGIGS